MTDKLDEALITVNGHVLTQGEAMTVRVALTDFLFTLSDPNGLGDDTHGRHMTREYRDCVKAILRLAATSPATEKA